MIKLKNFLILKSKYHSNFYKISILKKDNFNNFGEYLNFV